MGVDFNIAPVLEQPRNFGFAYIVNHCGDGCTRAIVVGRSAALSLTTALQGYVYAFSRTKHCLKLFNCVCQNFLLKGWAALSGRISLTSALK